MPKSRTFGIGTVVMLTMALVSAIGGAFAQQSSRPPTSLAIEKLIEAMRTITDVPYYFDQQGNLAGRSEQDEHRWYELVAQLNGVISAANPSDVDDEAVGDIADQFRDRLSFGGNPLAPSLGRIGSRGVLELVKRIEVASDPEIQYRLADGLFAVARRLERSDISNLAISRVVGLLKSPNWGVVITTVQTLGTIGPRARLALPALGDLLQAAYIEEQKGGVRLGPQASFIIQTAINQINGERAR